MCLKNKLQKVWEKCETKVSGQTEPGAEFREENADDYCYDGRRKSKFLKEMANTGRIISSLVVRVTNS